MASLPPPNLVPLSPPPPPPPSPPPPPLSPPPPPLTGVNPSVMYVGAQSFFSERDMESKEEVSLPEGVHLLKHSDGNIIARKNGTLVTKHAVRVGDELLLRDDEASADWLYKDGHYWHAQSGVIVDEGKNVEVQYMVDGYIGRVSALLPPCDVLLTCDDKKVYRETIDAIVRVVSAKSEPL